ncbi:hypothetical protein Palpr_2984 [Paludibacter propionicigenes WB4]|uniref:Uncharacterized protein n=1 Tax=Paludibacter propionicigenes (strain DSM 17365 / JCM 13257 / WB4) TaxID=694427 RepID=E4T0P9_PALPW|nr:hypothetical protein Palpr_2984 [Paludibacter propionicigenes WB4]
MQEEKTPVHFLKRINTFLEQGQKREPAEFLY